MFTSLSSYFVIFKNYLSYLFFGNEEEYKLKEIYLENNLDLNKIYFSLGKINKIIMKEKDFNKILFFLNNELKYENELIDYEKIVNLELEMNEKVKRIELITNLKSLIVYFDKLKIIKEEYITNSKNKND